MQVGSGADGSASAYDRMTEVQRGPGGVLYKARSLTLRRDVAIIVHAGAAADAERRERFVEECRALAELAGHPHLLPLLDCGFTADGRPYVVTDHVPGGSLGRRLARGGPLPAHRVLAIGAGAAEALEAAHERGIVHRDLTPRRLLLDREGNVRVTGFHLPAGGERRATPGFASPEAITDFATMGPLADVYSLGAVMAALLTGADPVKRQPGETELAFLLRAMSEPIPPLPAGVPDGLAEVIAHCVEKSPSRRPPSAGRLARLLRGLTVPAEPPLEDDTPSTPPIPRRAPAPWAEPAAAPPPPALAPPAPPPAPWAGTPAAKRAPAGQAAGRPAAARATTGTPATGVSTQRAGARPPAAPAEEPALPRSRRTGRRAASTDPVAPVTPLGIPQPHPADPDPDPGPAEPPAATPAASPGAAEPGAAGNDEAPETAETPVQPAPSRRSGRRVAAAPTAEAPPRADGERKRPSGRRAASRPVDATPPRAEEPPAEPAQDEPPVVGPSDPTPPRGTLVPRDPAAVPAGPDAAELPPGEQPRRGRRWLAAGGTATAVAVLAVTGSAVVNGLRDGADVVTSTPVGATVQAAPATLPTTPAPTVAVSAATTDPSGGAEPGTCGEAVRRDGRDLQACLLRRSPVPVYDSPGGAEVGRLTGELAWFAGQEEASTYTAGAERTSWWAFTEAENGSWGWVPVLYLARNDGDAPYGGLAECDDGGTLCSEDVSDTN